MRHLTASGDELTGLVEIDIGAVASPLPQSQLPIRAFRGSQIAVLVYETRDPEGIPGLRISVRRHDQKPLHDHWRTLYRIKDELVPDCEAVEIYPPASRLVDVANMYHLWVLPEGMVTGYGFGAGDGLPRSYAGGASSSSGGAP